MIATTPSGLKYIIIPIIYNKTINIYDLNVWLYLCIKSGQKLI